jgi:ribonuclease BN (tRNA processing enzyme)
LFALVGLCVNGGALAFAAPRTEVVVLGSGTPIPDPDRAGPAVAVVVEGTAYLFDAGAGVVRRAAAAARGGNRALDPERLGRVFLTHLHSDHTLGLADLLLTPWIQGRQAPLEVYGPPGTTRLLNGILDGNSEDVAERLASAGGPSRDGWRAVVHEVEDGTVYEDERVRVRAFAVPHSRWKHAFGYRVQTRDRTIVLSGDTRKSDAIARECNGCDVLLHEVYSDRGFTTIPRERQPYHAQAHTSASQLAAIAAAAKPRLLVLYHQLFFGTSEKELLAEVQKGYRGRVVSAHDLDRY